MLRRLMPILKLVIPAVLALAALDLLVFRSGFYYRWAERESTAGSVIAAKAWTLHQIRPGMRNVLVLGDSRIGQGFSSRVANAASAQTGVNYVGVAIPGSTPRVWYYFLRSVDPDATVFSAVALMADSFRDDVILEDMVNREVDLNYLVPLLKVQDLGMLPYTFAEPQAQERARLAIAFPAVAMQDDIRGLVRHPLARIKKLRRWVAVRWQMMRDYPGIDERLPELRPDAAAAIPIDIAGMRPGLQQRMRGYFQTLKMQPAADRKAGINAYRNWWVGGIAKRYRQRDIPVILFQIPRGPYHKALVPVRPPNGAYAQMAAAGVVELLPGDTFIELEQPQYFYDSLHLNSTGAREFSTRLPMALAPLLP